MIEVRNLLFQPLTFHLKGDGETVHLGPRERRLIEDRQMSPELEQARRRKMVSIRDLSDAQLIAAGAPVSLTGKAVATSGRKRRS